MLDALDVTHAGDTLVRLAAFVDATVGKRLTYKRLIAEVPA